ncbi:MAG TPA: galactokinase [Bryobacteraceae bacterium]|nr:galactokinase [Bryobacteraceae bacterium]
MIPPRTFRAPGRVNLIGEHTDYNLGFVLPIALDLATYIETTPASDHRLHARSQHRDEEYAWDPTAVSEAQPAQNWSDYVAGVARELALLGFSIPALNLKIRSDVPEGGGLSSSAALEVATALALLQGRNLDRLEIARLCQRAEMNFVGLPCGIMDQYVSVFGEHDSALWIDCRSLTAETVRLPGGLAIIAVNSMVRHALGDSAYRTRVAECAEAARILGVASLRDATDVPRGTSGPLRRARHIITENARVVGFIEAARAGDPAEMGRLFTASHASMRDDYEITCAEIDFLADQACRIPGCYGARMTGGGFGGCTVNLVEESAAAVFEAAIAAAYASVFNIQPRIYRCRPGNGASEVFLKQA